MSLPPNIGRDIEGWYFDIEEKTFDVNVFSNFLPLFATQYRRFLFDIGSNIESLVQNLHILMSGTNIELFLFDIKGFINQYLPYIDIVYDL